MKTPPFVEVWINKRRKRFYLFKDESVAFVGDNFVVNSDIHTKFPSLLFSFHESPILREPVLKVSVLNQDRDHMLLAGTRHKTIDVIRPTFFSFMNYEFFIDNINDDKAFSMTGIYSEDIYQAMEYSRSDRTVFIIGDTGTGKEFLARNIHYNSARRHELFSVVNCASLAPDTAERTLFGNVKGAFTDADEESKGEFISVGDGTLVIDDVGNLPLGLQPILLRALELKEVKPVGSDNIKKHNARVIVTSVYSPKELLYKWMLRRDLYYRIEECCVYLSELKKKPELVAKLAKLFAGDEFYFEDGAINKLLDYKWPGNIRELKNVVEKAKFLTEVCNAQKRQSPKYQIEGRHIILNNHCDDMKGVLIKDHSATFNLEDEERELIKKVLERNAWDVRMSCAELKICRSTLLEKIKQYKLVCNN